MPMRKTLSIRMVVCLLFCYSVSGCDSSERAAEQYYQAGLQQKTQQAFTQAAQQFRLALQQDPQHIQSRIQLGILLCREQKYQQAVEQFLSAQEYGDNSYKMFSLMGYAYEKLGKFKESEQFYQNAIERAPSLIDVRLRLAGIFEHQGKHREAAEVLEAILTIKPDIETAEILQARSAFLRSPESPDAHLVMADVYIRHGQIAQGLAEYRKAINFEPEDPNVLLEFGIFCLEREQFPTALTYLQKAAELGYTDHPFVRARLGDVYEHLEQFEEAIREYRVALDLNPEWYEIRAKIAELLAKVEKPIEAADELEELFHVTRNVVHPVLGTGDIPDVNQLWTLILQWRGETLRKAVVQLKSSARYPLIDALVNNSAPVILRVERASEYTILSKRLADQLGIRLTSRTSDVKFYVDGRLASAPLVTIPSLKVGGLEVRNIPVVIWNLSGYPGIDGFLGRSFLKHFQVEINNIDQLFILTKLYS